MIYLILGIVIGALVGIFWAPAAAFVAPVGDIFLNMLFVLVVPLVFFSVTLSFCNLRSEGRIGKVLGRTLSAFAIMWASAGILGYLSCLLVNPLGPNFDASAFPPIGAENSLSGADAVVNAVSVGDFPQLFSKFNLLPLMLFSMILGLGISSAGEKAGAFKSFMESGREVSVSTMNILMKAAPVGLGCYFAATIAEMGGQLLGGYLRVFLLLTTVCAIQFFVVNPFLVFVKGGPSALKAFARNIIPPTLTAMATQSSTLAMPGNITAARLSGTDAGVAEAVVPLSTNLLKAGSVANNIYKVVFLLVLSGRGFSTPGDALVCIGLAVLAAVVSGAVTNGGLSGEILICTLLGVDPAMVGIIMIIGTICDIPATIVNSQSNVVAAILSDSKKK